MRFIVCGDNHGEKESLDKLLENYPEAERFLHCGDVGLSPKEVEGFTVISGNNDYGSNYPDSLVVSVGSLRVFMIHGDQLRFGSRLESLVEKAKAMNCQVAVFGHTHVYQVKKLDGVLCINPGSLNYNRDGTGPSYAVVDVVDGEITVRRRLVSELL